MVLHTFGRDLKWNPHIHCLISEGGYSDDGEWLHITHFNYTFLRNAFRTASLTKWKACLVPLSKRSKPYVIPSTNKVSMLAVSISALSELIKYLTISYWSVPSCFS
ncbi:MAG: transposase [Lachnospiraceae bacterium]